MFNLCLPYEADVAIRWNKISIILLFVCLFFYTLFRPPADQQPASANGSSSSKNDTPPQPTSTNLTCQNQQTTAMGGGIKVGPLPPNLDELKVESPAIMINPNFTTFTDQWTHILSFSSFPAGGRAEAGVKSAGLNRLRHQKWSYCTAQAFSRAERWHQRSNIF